MIVKNGSRLSLSLSASVLATLISAAPSVAQVVDQDLVYSPVTPCRIFDTRQDAGSPIAQGATRDFVVYGDESTIAAQGGVPSGGCQAPRGEPAAAHINFTVVPSVGNGNIKVYPKDNPSASSTVNFKTDVNLANAITVKTKIDEADFDITVSASQTIHVLADVQGYYYRKVFPREVTVAPSGGDYTSVTGALNDSESWCPSADRGLGNGCLIKVATGLYFTSTIEPQSFISIVGASRNTTILLGFGLDAPVVRIDGDEYVTLENLSVVGFGNNAVDDVFAIQISTSVGNNIGTVIRDVGVIANGGLSSTTGIHIEDSGFVGDTGVMLADMDVITQTGADQTAIDLRSGEVVIDRVTAISLGDTALEIGPFTLAVPIRNSTFNGLLFDVVAPGATATLRHSAMANNLKDFTGSDITCLFVTGGNAMLDSACAPP